MLCKPIDLTNTQIHIKSNALYLQTHTHTQPAVWP